MKKPHPLPEGLGSPFSVVDARKRGLTADRLKASDLESHFRGSRSLATRHERPELHDAVRQRCAEYTTIAPEGFCFSHTTAAQLWGVALPRSLEDATELHVTVPRGEQQPRMRGVIAHRADVPTEVKFGLPVSSVETTWLDLASLLGLDALIVAGDSMVRRKRPLTSLDLLTAAMEGARGRRGLVRARSALAEVRPGTDSPPETRMRLILIRAGIREPVIGHAVIDQDGYFVGTPDLAFVDEKLALEYEGDGHRTDQRVFEDDIVRKELFERAGWRVVRVTARQLRDPVHFATRIRALLVERSP